MGRSVDWLDVYNDHGPEAVASALRAALEGPCFASSPRSPHSPHGQEHGAGGDALGGGDIGGGGYIPPAELILPAQAGLRAQVVLERMYRPGGPGEAWQLRRFGGAWWVYITSATGRPRWVKYDDEVIRAAVREMLEGMWLARTVDRGGVPLRPAKGRAGGEDDPHGRSWKYARFAPSDAMVEDILKAAVHRLVVRAESVPAWLPPDFDAQGLEVRDRLRWRRDCEDDGGGGPMDAGKVIAFANGLLDVEAWIAGAVRMAPHTSRWFSMSTLDSELPVGLLRERGEDEGAMAEWLGEHCPEWLDFVAELSGGSEAWIEALQRLVGYLLTLDTSLDVVGWIQGPPGSGKGTLVEAIEAAVGYDQVARTDLDTLASQYGVAPLVGKSVAVISEMHVGSYTNVAAALQKLKSISGGDPQHLNDKFLRIVSRVKMTVRFLITPNDEQRLPDPSAAMTRRLVVLPVIHQPARPDPGLSERLQAERAGVRVWALLGLRRLWRDVRRGERGFVLPEEGRELLLEIEASASPMKAFLRECCVVGVGQSCTTDLLWDTWKAWRVEEELSDKMAKQTFGRQLRAAAAFVRRDERRIDGKRAKVYVGVRPLLDIDEEQQGMQLNNVRAMPGYAESVYIRHAASTVSGTLPVEFEPVSPLPSVGE